MGNKTEMEEKASFRNKAQNKIKLKTKHTAFVSIRCGTDKFKIIPKKTQNKFSLASEPT